MSSWYDKKSLLGSWARTAMADAQRVLDKALDIREEDGNDDMDDVDVGDKSSVRKESVASEKTTTPSGSPWISLSGSLFEPTELAAALGIKSLQSVEVVEPDLEESEPDRISCNTEQPLATVTAESPESLCLLDLDDEAESSDASAAKEDVLQPIPTESGAHLDTKSDHSKPDTEDTETMSMSLSSTTTIITTSSHGQSLASDTTEVTPVLPNDEPVIVHVKEEEEEEEKALCNGPATFHGGLDEVVQRGGLAEPEQEGEEPSAMMQRSCHSGRGCSGHSSGDDLDTFTTTSSEIEVISSPGCSENRPGSPVNSCKMDRPSFVIPKMAPSKSAVVASDLETSVLAYSGLQNLDYNALLKKIGELSEILDVREASVVQLSRANVELQEQNMDLASQLTEALKIESKLSEANSSTDDLMHRISGLEQKLQQATSECESLRQQNIQLKKDHCSRPSQHEWNRVLAEKDELIADLRHEGENLSKQAGKQSDMIKKLRAKEKSQEKELKSTKGQLEDKVKECERLKKSLGAKGDMELKQIEAINELSSANSRLQELNSSMANELEDAREKANGLRISLEGAYKELAELRQGLQLKMDEVVEAERSKEVETRERLEQQCRRDELSFQQERDHLLQQIDQLRMGVADKERRMAQREEQMRLERKEFLCRLEQSEARHEELSATMASATRPLLRQIESLQCSLNESQKQADRTEQSLTERIQQLSEQLAAAQQRERVSCEQYSQMSARAAALESQLNSLKSRAAQLEADIEAEQAKVLTVQDSLNQEKAKTDTLKKSFAVEISELKKEKDLMESSLNMERQSVASEKARNALLAQQMRDREKRLKELHTELDLLRSVGPADFRRSSEKSSPTPSLEQSSWAGSSSDPFWQDELFESRSGSLGPITRGSSSAVYESGRAAGASLPALIESLQSQLKQKEGEILQLQMDLSTLERIKENLVQQVSTMSEQIQRVAPLQEELRQLEEAFRDKEDKYQTLLTMYGEKVEESEELRLDLQDVKEMYKLQIEEVLKQQK